MPKVPLQFLHYLINDNLDSLPWQVTIEVFRKRPEDHSQDKRRINVGFTRLVENLAELNSFLAALSEAAELRPFRGRTDPKGQLWKEHILDPSTPKVPLRDYDPNQGLAVKTLEVIRRPQFYRWGETNEDMVEFVSRCIHSGRYAVALFEVIDPRWTHKNVEKVLEVVAKRLNLTLGWINLGENIHAVIRYPEVGLRKVKPTGSQKPGRRKVARRP